MPDDFEIPETDRIGAMMDDLFDGPAPTRAASPSRRTPSRRTPLHRTPPPRSTAGRRPRLGPVTLARFADGVNWMNVAGFESPLVPPPEPRIGGLTLGTFAAAVNWRNAADAAKLLPGRAAIRPPDSPATAPQPTVDDLLNDFSWD